MNKYVEILKEKHLKITPQRLSIMKYLDDHRTHPTADQIYYDLKHLNPSLSKTTVYNSLHTLQKNHVIQTISISTTDQRYDIKTKTHHHFLCIQCGAILDIDIDCPNEKKILQQGHKVDEVHGYFKGICKKCLQKQGGNNVK
ncbi:MAG: Fur family transcriptional regulator [Thermoplasmatota archaeon]